MFQTIPDDLFTSSPRPDPRRARTSAEINLGDLAHNIDVITRTIANDSEFLAVVKADAYGHGAPVVARECERRGVRQFGVATIEEAKSLRRAGIAGDIYLFTPFLPPQAIDVASAGVVPFVSSLAQIEALIAAAESASGNGRCFLTIDSGMGREGCSQEEALAIWRRTQGSNVQITGLVTHMSRADEPGIGDAVSRAQSDRFFDVVAILDQTFDLAATATERGAGLYLSLANSPATLRLQQEPLPRWSSGYLKRAGLLPYGIEPYAGAFAELDLRPVLAWHARVVLIRDFAPGATIGYGQSYTVEKRSRIATLAVGYGDGLSRRLSNRGYVLIHGSRRPIVGRISMDQCQVDVTNVGEPVLLGDTATLLGCDGNDRITALEMAQLIDTTPHEPTCALSERVPRIYV